MEIPFAAELEAYPGGDVLVHSLKRLFEELQTTPFRLGNNYIFSGAGSPEGVIVASIGDLYVRTDAANQPFYVKTSGSGTSTGWMGVAATGPTGATGAAGAPGVGQSLGLIVTAAQHWLVAV